MKSSLIPAAVLLACTSAAWANVYIWPTAQDGEWTDPTKWTSSDGGVSYPDNGDSVGNFKWGGYTVTLTKDISIAQLGEGGGSGGGIKVLDLGRNRLSCTKSPNSVFVNEGTAPTEPGQQSYTEGFLFKDGSMDCAGLTLGAMGQGKDGRMVMDLSNVRISAYVNSWSGPSRIFVRDGSVWTVTGETRLEAGLWHDVKNTRYACLVVDGAASRVDSGDYDIIVGGYDGWLYVKNGAAATYKDVNVGGSFRSTNAVACVDGATLTAVGTLRVGTDNINPTGEGGKGTFRSDIATGRSATLKVLGVGACVTSAAMEVYDGTDSGLDFAVPESGWTSAPVKAGSFAIVPRDLSRDEDFGPIRFAVSCYAWAKTHPEETQTLIELVEGNAEALAAIAERIVWPDYPAALVEEGKVPTLSVSEDGTRIVLTAPAVNLKPSISVRASPGTATGAKTLTLTVRDYGFGATSLTGVTCLYADNEEFTGAKTADLLNGGDPISADVPCDVPFVLDGGFVQHRRYWAKVTAVNELDHSEEVTVTFAGDGVAETLQWATGASGAFEDASKWLVKATQQPAGTYPHAEDVVNWPKTGDCTVTLAEDASVVRFEKYEGEAAASQKLTFEMNGHRLDFTDARIGTVFTLDLSGWAAVQDDLNPCGATMVFRNGTVLIPGAPVSGSAPGIELGEFVGGSNNSGTLILEDGADFTANIKYFTNESRLFIRSGSAFHTVSQDLQMNRHTVYRPCARIVVTGEGSLLDLKTYELMVRSDKAQCHIEDGGKLIAGNLHVGYTNHMWGTGSPASDDTLVRFWNGTGVLSQDIELGWNANLKCNARLVLAGTNTSVTAAGMLRIHEGLASSLEFEVPAAGFVKCPLSVGGLAFAEKPAGNDDFGPTTLKIAMKDWMRANPEATLDLVTLATPDAAALETLKGYAVFTDVNPARHPDTPILSVSADGTRLVLTAPPKKGLVLIFR